MFNPDRVQNIQYIQFRSLPEEDMEEWATGNGANLADKPFGYVDLKLDDGTEITLGVGLLATLGVQMSFPVLLESAKRIKSMSQRQR